MDLLEFAKCPLHSRSYMDFLLFSMLKWANFFIIFGADKKSKTLKLTWNFISDRLSMRFVSLTW